jgi:hypothetical protein
VKNWTLKLAVLAVFSSAISLAQGKFAATTYHYDTFRTGWNSHETLLNPSFQNRRPPEVPDKFGLLAKVVLDDNVYAQPLVMPDVNVIGGPFAGKHDVVYVATENNTVYAIDAHSGQILLTRNFGPPVDHPGSCENNGPHVGIESTPVIDAATGILYFVAYTNIQRPTYRVHAVDIGSLQDRLSPVVVSASHKLTNGSTISFNAVVQRQRPALLLADGNVYAAFGSFCDNRNDANESRGWVLGWQASTLKSLASNYLTNRISSSNKHLSAIWMSGYGPSAVAGHIYFTTGNSNDSYNKPNNLSESVVKVLSNLTKMLDFFTPNNDAALDSRDLDFGSGGVMVIPDQSGKTKQMAVSAGKDGRMFLMNRNHLGGRNTAANQVLGTFQIGACWCGESFYANNVVSSGGTKVGVWPITTSSSANGSLGQPFWSEDLGGNGDGGFFTSVSSNGGSNTMIWAVSRGTMNLFAFQPIPESSTVKTLGQWPAGRWDDPSLKGANSTAVPVVANGHVYVASFKELDIFGFMPPVIITTNN